MSKSKKKPVVVVLGMHRSGTSAITRGLQVLGIELGDELMPPAPDNETGFFEDREINALNVELLRSLGHDWHTLGPIKSRDLAATSLEPLRQRAMQVLRVKMRGRESFGLKDPRLSRLLPFWKRVFQRLNLEARYIIAVRNPISVTRSLEARNQIAPEKSYYLWLEHVVSSVLDTKGSKRVVVDYDRLLDKPEIELERIAQLLRIPGPKSVESVDEYREQYLNDQLRHFRFRLRDLGEESSASSNVMEAYRLLSETASDKRSLEAPAVQKAFQRFQEFLVSAAPAFRCIDKQERDLASLRQLNSEHESKVTFVEGVLLQRNNQLEAAQSAASAYAEELTVLEGQLESTQIGIRNLQSEAEASSRELDERDNRLAELATQFETVATELSDREQEVAASREALERLKGELEHARTELANRKQTLESLQGSNENLETALRERTRNVEQLNGHIAELTTKLNAAVADRSNQEREINLSHERVENLRNELQARTSQLEALQGDIQTSHAQLQHVQNELATRELAMESALRERSRHVDQLNANIAELTTSLGTSVAQLKIREKETAASQAELKRLKEELEAKTKQLEAVTGELRSSQAQLQVAHAKATSLELQTQEARQTIDQLREEVTTLRHAIEHTTQGILGVANSLESAVERRIFRGGH